MHPRLLFRQQPQQLPIPFEQPSEDARANAARQSLEQLGITQPQLVATILGYPKHLDQLFKFTCQLKTDKVKATKNPGGLFLKICGLHSSRNLSGAKDQLLIQQQRRKLSRLTQAETAAKVDVGLRFVREMEHGKATLQLTKANQVLRLFGHQLGPVPMDRQQLLDENG